MDENNKEQEDWKINVRSDLWSTMNLTQLVIQQELVLDKLAKLSMLPSTPVIINLNYALTMALNDLNILLNITVEKNKHKNRISM